MVASYRSLLQGGSRVRQGACTTHWPPVCTKWAVYPFAHCYCGSPCCESQILCLSMWLFNAMAERLLEISSHQHTPNFNTCLSHHGYDWSQLYKEFYEYSVGKMVLDGVSGTLLIRGHGFVVQTSTATATHSTLFFPRFHLVRIFFFFFWRLGGTS